MWSSDALTSSRNRNKTADKFKDPESIVKTSYDNQQYNILNNSGQRSNSKKATAITNGFKSSSLSKNNFMSKNLNSIYL